MLCQHILLYSFILFVEDFHAILPFGTEHLKEYIDQIFTLNTCFPLGVYDDGFVEVWDAMEVFYK